MPRARTVTVNNTAPAVAVSDQARSVPDYQPSAAPKAVTPPEPGQPYHSPGWGANGTHDAPPRTANSYRAEVKPEDMPDIPADLMESNPRNGELAPNTPSAQAPVPPQQQQLTPPATPPSAPDDRVATLEQQVANLGTLLATVSAQLQQVTTSPVPPILPGTANPKAPTPHVGPTVQGTVAPKVEGPVIPKPTAVERYDDSAPRLPNQAKIPQLQPGEEELSQAEYIEKHFRYRDLSIEQIAYMCHMTTVDVIEILKELGYHFVDGAQ